MHHCLFYDAKFCNADPATLRPDNNWNKNAVPLIKDKAIVFVRNVGEIVPYFSNNENNVSYYGVGFSENRFKSPPTMLKVTISDNDIVVKPILLIQDLTKTKYNTEKKDIPIKRGFSIYIKSLMAYNLKGIFLSFDVLIIFLFILILVLILKLKKIEVKK